MKYIILITLLFLQLYSAPARGGIREFIQADGSTFKAKAKGNQHLNWIESEDGEILKYNKMTNNYEFAEIKSKHLLPSGQKYIKQDTNSDRQSPSLNIKKIDKFKVYELWQQKQAEKISKIKHTKY